MKRYENGEYIDLSDEEIEVVEQEKEDYLFSSAYDKEENNTANAIREMVTGNPVSIKDISPLVDKIVIKTEGEAPATKVFAVGQNVWDEAWVLNDACIGSKNYIPVVSGEEYYFYCNSPAFSVEEYDTPIFNSITFFDSQKKQLSVVSAQRNSKIKIPDGCKYIKFVMHEAYGISYGHKYNNDICINISDKKVDGTYVPYKVEEYNVNSNGDAVLTAPFDYVTTVFSEDESVILKCEYSKDIKGVIDDAVEDVSESWELIAKGELTQEVSSITLDGFSCSKIELLISVATSETNPSESAMRVRTNENSNTGGGSDNSLTRMFRQSGTNTSAMMLMEMHNKTIKGQLVNSGVNKTYANYYYSDPSVSKYDSITAVYLNPVTSGCVFGVGTTYELWGVRE